MSRHVGEFMSTVAAAICVGLAVANGMDGNIVGAGYCAGLATLMFCLLLVYLFGEGT